MSRHRAPESRVPLQLERPELVLWVAWAGGPFAASLAGFYLWVRPSDWQGWGPFDVIGLLGFMLAQPVTALAMLALTLSHHLRDTAEFWLLLGYWLFASGLAVLVMMGWSDRWSRVWLLGTCGGVALMITILCPLLAWRRGRGRRLGWMRPNKV